MFQQRIIGSGTKQVVKRGNLAVIAGMTRREKVEAFPPTPEQMARHDYVLGEVVDATPQGRLAIGKAYRRRPKFETIEGLTVPQIRALRAYRATFDASEISEVKSALDIRPRGTGGSDAAFTRLEAKVSGSWMLQAMEEAVLTALPIDRANALQTLRDVGLFDLTFKDVAIKRFGGREVSRIDIKRAKPNYTTLEVRSGTHRTVVRDEFFLAVVLLVDAVGRRG